MTGTDLLRSDDHGVATLTLNRAAQRNALDGPLILALSMELSHIDKDNSIRAIVLRGADGAFCSGADLTWLQSMSGRGPAEEARSLAHLLLRLKTVRQPTLALIEGVCHGAGVALAACCDIALAGESATFAVPAVRLGAAPTTIAPFLVEAIGLRQARRYLLTGETFGPDRAADIGLVHGVCLDARLGETAARLIADLLAGGPVAQADTKQYLAEIAGRPIDPKLIEEMARRTTAIRRSPEAREGLAAFIEKRPADWLPD